MQQQPPATEFGIAEARRVLGEVFAPWVLDLNLSIERFDFAPSGDTADWQPGAILRLPFSERLCRKGGTVSGQALLAFADTAMVIANFAANRGYRALTTVDQTMHFMRAVSASDVLADARVVRLGRTMALAASRCCPPPTTSRWRWSRARSRCCNGIVGWAKAHLSRRAHHLSSNTLPDGGHASVSPSCNPLLIAP